MPWDWIATKTKVTSTTSSAWQLKCYATVYVVAINYICLINYQSHVRSGLDQVKTCASEGC